MAWRNVACYLIVFSCALFSLLGSEEQPEIEHEIARQTLRDAFYAILTGDREPKYSAEYQDTPQNRAFLITEICGLYSAFFSEEIHTEEMYYILQQRGMWIQKRHSYDPIPTFEQTSLFANALENILHQLMTTQDSKKIWIHLGYDYSPSSEPLEFAFKEAGLNDDFFYLLPYKSHTHIRIAEGVIDLYLNLAGPLI